MDRFIGKVAVVTGASRGIGKEITKELLKKGVHVVGLGRNLNLLQVITIIQSTGNVIFFSI